MQGRSTGRQNSNHVSHSFMQLCSSAVPCAVLRFWDQVLSYKNSRPYESNQDIGIQTSTYFGSLASSPAIFLSAGSSSLFSAPLLHFKAANRSFRFLAWSSSVPTGAAMFVCSVARNGFLLEVLVQTPLDRWRDCPFLRWKITSWQCICCPKFPRMLNGDFGGGSLRDRRRNWSMEGWVGRGEVE